MTLKKEKKRAEREAMRETERQGSVGEAHTRGRGIQRDCMLFIGVSLFV